MTVRIVAPPPEAGLSAGEIAAFECRAERVLTAAAPEGSEVSVALVDDAEIAALNERYRDREGPTDVLSFSLLEGEHADHRGDQLGDVVISLATARRQAQEQDTTLDRELLRLLIHGVLHLLGHDHEEAEEARRMQAEEERLWQAASAP